MPVPRSPLDDALAEEWVPQADVCVGAAPMFEERFALNDACVRHRKPLVNCAMYDTEATISTFAAGGQPCLRCITPRVPDYPRQQETMGLVVRAAPSCNFGARVEERDRVCDKIGD